MAVSAVDVGLWDLAAKLADLPLVTMLGAVREAIPVYGSGGFTSYSNDRLTEQLGGWAAAGMRRVKMKIGRDEAADRRRVAIARDAIGDAELFVDANGAYSVPQALRQAGILATQDVRWFEEPVSSDDLAGLRAVRDRAPAGMAVAAGEYGYEPVYFRRMLGAGAVDVLQADATRCGGVTGFLAADALCDARGVPLSAHCAPQVHAHLACASARALHVEYFHDHARIEQMLFDGALLPSAGALRPDTGRLGLGLELRSQDAQRYAL
jgi:L-alanine-DL-glutamate epimerase-like enolase superfamily enzyme